MRKSQTKPPVQVASALQVLEERQMPSPQYDPTAQSPSVRQAVPGTHTPYAVSQSDPDGQSASRVHVGAATHRPVDTSQRVPALQSAISSQGQPTPTQYIGRSSSSPLP
jgi:hypothetical protein